jgi:uncharacterized protein (TIGR03067 family)
MAMAIDRTQDASDHDLALLQGRWKQVGFEEDGLSDLPAGQGGIGATTTIEGHRYSVHVVGGKCMLEGTFTLDASAKPKAITWVDAVGPDAGKPLPASYELNGDRFVFIAADAGSPRPTAFHTAPGQVMRAFVRIR